MAFQLTLRPGGPSSPGDPGSPGSPADISKQKLFTLKLYLYICVCVCGFGHFKFQRQFTFILERDVQKAHGKKKVLSNTFSPK